MPKKQAKNAFYFYMMQFKEEQRLIGIHYKNIPEIAEAAGPSWKVAPPAVRRKYEEMAKIEKQKLKLGDTKYTSTGVPIAEIERREKEALEAREAELKDIKNMVTLNSVKGTLLQELFYIMDVNFYCKIGNTDSTYLIGESTLLRFNLQFGIRDQYHEIINPGAIPKGLHSIVKDKRKEVGLEMPDENDIHKTNYIKVLATIVDYLKQQNPNSNVLPPIFTMPEKVEPIQDFFRQMCNRATEDETLFRIYRLDTLFYNIMNAIKSRENEGFPKESLALELLNKYPFMMTPGLGCEHHENQENSASQKCSLVRAKNWAFTILARCCPVAGIEVVSGKHIPFGFDITRSLSLKEQNWERAPPSVAGLVDPSTSTSMINDSLNTLTLNSTAESTVSDVRVHEPLRMPRNDYSQVFRPAPELTESNFPTLSAGAGRGRGRSGSSSKLKFKK